MKVLSLTSCFPSPQTPNLGIFVFRRLCAMARTAEIRILVPVLRSPLSRARAAGSTPATLGPLEGVYRTCTYVPGTGALTPLLIFPQVAGTAVTLHASYRFDIIDAHFGYPDGIVGALLARRLGRPLAVTLRGSELLHERYPLRRAQMRWALRQAAAVIAVSAELAALAVRLGADIDRVSVVPNGIDRSIFHFRGRDECRARHGLPLNRPILLSAGHLIELKGHHHLIRAVSALRVHGVDPLLLIVGESIGAGTVGFARQLRALSTELKLRDDVRFLGRKSPEVLAELLAAADAFCLASEREGCPNVVCEALACGTPVVASSVGAVPDLLNADTGLLTTAGDVVGLAAAIRCALERNWNRNEIARQGQMRTWDHVAADAIAALDKGLSRR